jgi:hypothetical protein
MTARNFTVRKRPNGMPWAATLQLGCLLNITWLGAAAPAESYEDAVVVGQRHPDFVLPHIDDRKPVSLSQHRGKKLLLVHFASW